jgi:hypothetical protein
VISLVLRMRRARGVERAQLQWFMLGGLVLVLGLTGTVVIQRAAGGPTVWANLCMALGLLGPPAGIAVAMVRHRLFDVEVVLNRGLVLAGVSGLVVAAYVAAIMADGPPWPSWPRPCPTSSSWTCACPAAAGSRRQRASRLATRRWRSSF